jgi:hypothetical protein
MNSSDKEDTGATYSAKKQKHQISNVFDRIKLLRNRTRQKARFLDDEQPKKKFGKLGDFMSLFETRLKDFNISHDQLKWFYPNSNVKESSTFINQSMLANLAKEKALLDEMVPPITPPDDYFYPEELDALINGDGLLRYPAKHYISM